METTPDRPDRTDRLLHGTLETFALEETIKWLRNEAGYLENGHNALALVKGERLRVVMVCLQKDSRMHQHHAPSSFTLTLLEGQLSFTLYLNETATVTELSQGQFLVLEEPRRHEVLALYESAFLLTILMP